MATLERRYMEMASDHGVDVALHDFMFDLLDPRTTARVTDGADPGEQGYELKQTFEESVGGSRDRFSSYGKNLVKRSLVWAWKVYRLRDACLRSLDAGQAGGRVALLVYPETARSVGLELLKRGFAPQGDVWLKAAPILSAPPPAR